MDFSDSPVSQSSVPLHGTISPYIFASNINDPDTRNAILDNLDIRVTLPDVTDPAEFQSTVLAIKGKNDGGARSIDVASAGQKVVVFGTTINFALAASTVKTAGQPDVTIMTGTAKPGISVTVPLFHDFTLTDISLSMKKVDGEWEKTISGSSTLNSKEVDVSYVHKTGGSKYLDITTTLTLADIIGQPSLPGLDDIEATEIQIYDTHWRLTVNVKGTYAYVNVFKPDGGSHQLTAVTIGPDTISPAQFIPGAANTPLKDVTFNGIAFVLAPVALVGQLHRDDMPDDLALRLSKKAVPGDIMLKSGLNVFGNMDITASGEMATLLSHVGITEVSLPLNGGFSTSVFSDLSSAGSTVLDDIVSNLDMSIPLPNIDIPGVSSLVNVQSSILKLTGSVDGGARSVDVDVAGVLDIDVAGQTLDLDFDVDVVEEQGQSAKISVSATQESGTGVSLSLIETIDITDLDFEMNQNKAGKYLWTLSGNASLKSNAVTVKHVHNPGGDAITYITSTLTLAEIIGDQSLPGLDDVVLDEIQVWSDHYVITGTFKTVSGNVLVQKVTAGHLVAASFGNFTPGDLVPDVSGTPLNDVSFDNMVFVYNPGTADADISTLSDAISSSVEASNPSPVIQPGMNVFGHMDISTSGEIKDLLSDVGITDVKLPLNGTIDKSVFSGTSSATQSIKDTILESVDLKLQFSTLPSIPDLGSYLTFTDAHMSIKGGTDGSGNRTMDYNVGGDTTLTVGTKTFTMGVDVDEVTDTDGSSSYKITADQEAGNTWDDVFGQTWLDLSNIGLTIQKKTDTDGNEYTDISLAADITIGSDTLDIAFGMHDDDGTITDESLTLVGPISLSDIPGVGSLSGAGSFTLSNLEITKHGIQAETSFGGNDKLDFYAFDDGGGWNFALEQDNFKLSEIIPGTGSTPLQYITLSEASLFVSENGLTGTLSSFGDVAQNALKRIYKGDLSTDIAMSSGVGILAAFNPSNSGVLADGLSRLGMGGDDIVLVGELGGIFSGNPSADIRVTIDPTGQPNNMPSKMSSTTTEVVFSILLTDGGDDLNVEIGLETDISHDIGGGETLVFEAKIALDIQIPIVNIKIVADLKAGNAAANSSGVQSAGLKSGGSCDAETKGSAKGPAKYPAGWKHPFGIPGLTIYNLGMDMGLDEDGAVHLGFIGAAKIAGDHLFVAVDADLEGGIVPTDVAFIGCADTIPMDFLEQVAIEMVAGSVTSLNLGNMPVPEFKTVKLAFVTAGASDPDLDITGEGFAMSGTLNWLGKELGSVDTVVSPTKGIYVHDTIDDLDLGGVISLKNNQITIDAPIPGASGVKLPSFKINSNIDLIGFTETLDVEFDQKGAKFSFDASLTSAFDMTIDIALTGVDLSVTHPSFSGADFGVAGSFHADFVAFIEQLATDTATDVFKDLNKVLTEATTAITAAQKKVDGLNTQINAERAKLRRAKHKAEAKIDEAKKRVDSLQGVITSDWTHYHHCHGWGKVACKIKWGIEIGGLKATKEVADLALEAARELIAKFPMDLDPVLMGLIGLKDIAKTELKLAKYAIEGLEDLDNWAIKGLDKIAKFPGGSIEVVEASFSGDLDDIINNDAPVDLFIDIKIFGAEMKDTFAFRFDDLADELSNIASGVGKDAAHMSLLGVYAVDHLFENLLKDVPKPLMAHIRAITGRRIDKAQSLLTTDLAAQTTNFAHYHALAKELKAANVSFATAYATVKMTEKHTPLDEEPASMTLSDAVLTIGTTGLCLNTEWTGAVQFGRCAGPTIQSYNQEITYEDKTSTLPEQEFTTSSVLDAKNKDTGYVTIQAQGHCMEVKGTWGTGEVDFADGSVGYQSVFTPSNPGGNGDYKHGRPYMSACSATDEQYWKILAHGDAFTQIINRATQTCVHFFDHDYGYTDILEMNMYPCLGGETQVFQASPPKPPVLHAVNAVLKNALYGQCLHTPGKSTTCDAGAPKFNFFVDYLNRWRFMDLSSKKCLSMGTRSGQANCDGDDRNQLFEAVKSAGGYYFYVRDTNNLHRQECLSANTGQNVAPCEPSNPAQLWVMPSDDRVGGVWTKVSGSLPAGVKFNAAYTKTEQSKTAINSRATTWNTKKTKLLAAKSAMTVGQSMCLDKNSDCYVLSAKTSGKLYKMLDRNVWPEVTLTGLSKTGNQPAFIEHLMPVMDDDLSVKGLAAINASSQTPQPEPAWYACRFNMQDNFSNMTMLTGVVDSQYCDSSDSYGNSTGDRSYELLQNGYGLSWAAAGGGFLPLHALPTGLEPISTKSNSLETISPRYTCRSMVNQKTKIGWTSAGNYCRFIVNWKTVITANFEVLVVDETVNVPPPPASTPVPATKHKAGSCGGWFQPSC